jgi:hypothetical protein
VIWQVAYQNYQKGFRQGGKAFYRALDDRISTKGYIALYDINGNYRGMIKTNKDVSDFNQAEVKK